ncbi:MAG: FAD-dependent oxidoreductase [Candidatus Omnitrophota bacterium]
MRIIIVGAGFSGIAALVRLASAKVPLDILLIDKKETFDFLPLLPDCFARNISPRFITCELGPIALKYGARFFNKEVIALDPEKKEVITSDAVFPYDYLILASGTETNSYGNDAVKKYGYTLDSAQDAVKITAALGRNQYENFIVAGAGYSGIEVACGLRCYLNRHGKKGRIIIAERAVSILGPLPDWMKAYVSDNLRMLDIEVATGVVVERIEERSLRFSDSSNYNNSMLIWTAGVRCADFIQKLSLGKNPQGRLKVDMSLKAHESIFVAGDAACFSYGNTCLRMAVQFAITQGLFAGAQVIRSIKGLEFKEYQPFDFGYIIPMANNRACGQVMGIHLKGRLAIVLHFLMCIYRLYGWRNKVGVLKALMLSKVS